MSDSSFNFQGLPPEFRIEKLTPKQIEAISDLQIKIRKLDYAEKQSKRQNRLQTLVLSSIIGLFTSAILMFMTSSFMGNKAEVIQKTSQSVINITLPIVTMITGYCFGKNSKRDETGTKTETSRG
jgi:Na+-transporting methylmalonyl-CoA/oxaloacetate decarboxylase beta subunit